MVSQMSEAQKEHWMNRAMQMAVISLLTWNIYTTHQLSIAVAVLGEKVAQIERFMEKEDA